LQKNAGLLRGERYTPRRQRSIFPRSAGFKKGGLKCLMHPKPPI
jgi:hypothetical protein